MIVQVKKVPVRYKGKTYRAGEELEIKKDHFNENLMVIIDDAEDDKPKPPSKLTKDEIKTELKKLNIPFDDGAKREDLLDLLLNPPGSGSGEPPHNPPDHGSGNPPENPPTE